MKKLLFLLVLGGFLTSCGNDNEIIPEEPFLNGNSTIIVTILKDKEPVGQGITVFTNPATLELTTDAFGQVDFENLQSGKYDVYSYETYFGSGKTTVVLNDDLQRIDINLIQGITIDPFVEITSPELNQGFSSGEEIEFTANINDSTTAIEDLIIEWESDIDGKLTGSNITSQGIVSLITSSLSNSEHHIKLTVTNQLGIAATSSILINTLSPKSLDINLTQSSNFDISINWNSSETDISKFELYRLTDDYNSEVLLYTLNNNEMNYIDSKVPFTDSVYYYVKAYNNLGYSSKSNLVRSKGAPVFQINVDQAEISSDGSMIYLRSGNEIISIDINNLSIKNSRSFNGTIGYFHIGNNGFGDELYIPNSDGWLYIYDLSSFELKESINVGVPVDCVISNGTGLLYTSVSPSPWWEDPLRVFNRASLSFVDGGGDFNDTRLKLLPSGNEIIEISTSISPIDMDYYRFDASGNFVEHTDDKYHGDHSLDPDIFKIAPSNNYLITSSEGTVYKADASMNYVGSLPRGSDFFSDFEFNATGTSIYAGLLAKKEISIYNQQNLNKTGKIETKGYPFLLFRKANQLIVLSSPYEFDNYYGPQKIGIEIHDLSNY